MPDVIAILRELKQSSESSVVAGTEIATDVARPSISHPIEQWLVELILDQLTDPSDAPQLSLVVIAGNAGDGKSHLLRAIRRRLHEEDDLGPEMIEWILDATHSESRREESTDRLMRYFSPFSDDANWCPQKLHVVAINTGAVVQFFESQTAWSRYHDLRDVLFAQLGILGLPRAATRERFWTRFDRVVCVDLDRRMLFQSSDAEEDFLERMLDSIDPERQDSIVSAAENSCMTCPSNDDCPVSANLEAARHPRVRQRLRLLLLDVALEDRIHVGPRGLWHLLYQMTVGGLDAAYMSAGRQLPTCSDMTDIRPQDRHRGLFYNSLFHGATARGHTGGSALLVELRRVDPAFHFSLSNYEDSLIAGLSQIEDLQLARKYALEIGVDAEVLQGVGSSVDRSNAAVRRRYFFKADEPDPARHTWLKNWHRLLVTYQAGILAGSPPDNEDLLIQLRHALQNMYSSSNFPGTGYWKLQLPWRNSQPLFARIAIRTRPSNEPAAPRALGPDTNRPGGRRPVNDTLADRLGALPLAVPIYLRNGPDVYVTWPLYRFLQRIADLSYLANSLDSERVQHMERVANSMTARAAVEHGVAILDGDRAILCETDEQRGFYVTSI